MERCGLIESVDEPHLDLVAAPRPDHRSWHRAVEACGARAQHREAVGRSIGMGARSEGYKRAAGTEEDIAS